jgi:hypothetical protein
VIVRGSSRELSLPLEHAFAMSLPGGPYAEKNLDPLPSKVREQWKTFNPIGNDHAEYIASINALLKDLQPSGVPASIDSVKPVLVSIERMNSLSYSVISIRQYVISVNGEQFKSIKANGSAMVLRDTQLVRVDILRELHTPLDVDAVRGEIAAWSAAIASTAVSAHHLRP